MNEDENLLKLVYELETAIKNFTHVMAKHDRVLYDLSEDMKNVNNDVAAIELWMESTDDWIDDHMDDHR